MCNGATSATQLQPLGVHLDRDSRAADPPQDGLYREVLLPLVASLIWIPWNPVVDPFPIAHARLALDPRPGRGQLDVQLLGKSAPVVLRAVSSGHGKDQLGDLPIVLEAASQGRRHRFGSLVSPANEPLDFPAPFRGQVARHVRLLGGSVRSPHAALKVIGPATHPISMEIVSSWAAADAVAGGAAAGAAPNPARLVARSDRIPARGSGGRNPATTGAMTGREGVG